MTFIKLTPEQKRLRKVQMYDEYLKITKKSKLRKFEIREKLAKKYQYENERVVESTLAREKRDRKITEAAL